ncbi:hypothetical protein PYCCODRAFT_297895 [Trametes coccinea BRFM310]|uniref:Uncharacterized protein n=1 Tax=Trametes coccinea (strain BRFM310) TaxID=1353009 RepID=A0A1Y2I4V3_TRAC3|nr:hypothetical protein PYCCODRAFT_297895 [Trametes coccinea BRFM310]
MLAVAQAARLDAVPTAWPSCRPPTERPPKRTVPRASGRALSRACIIAVSALRIARTQPSCCSPKTCNPRECTTLSQDLPRKVTNRTVITRASRLRHDARLTGLRGGASTLRTRQLRSRSRSLQHASSVKRRSSHVRHHYNQ